MSNHARAECLHMGSRNLFLSYLLLDPVILDSKFHCTWWTFVFRTLKHRDLMCTKSSQLASLTTSIIFTPPLSPLTRNAKEKREEMQEGNMWPYLTFFIHLAYVVYFRHKQSWLLDWIGNYFILLYL